MNLQTSFYHARALIGGGAAGAGAIDPGGSSPAAASTRASLSPRSTGAGTLAPPAQHRGQDPAAVPVRRLAPSPAPSPAQRVRVPAAADNTCPPRPGPETAHEAPEGSVQTS